MKLKHCLYRCTSKYIPDLPIYKQDTFIDWVEGGLTYNKYLDIIAPEAKQHGKLIWHTDNCDIANQLIINCGLSVASSHDEYVLKNNSNKLYYISIENLKQLKNNVISYIQTKTDLTIDEILIHLHSNNPNPKLLEHSQLIDLLITINDELTFKYADKLEWYYFI
jgi:hypothetical protein